MKKVLFISYFFPPLGGPAAQRISKFVKYLSDFGWSASVLTVNNPYYRLYSADALNDIGENISIIRTNAFLPKRFIKRIFHILRRKQSVKSSFVSEQISNKPGIGSFFKSIIYPWLFIPDEYIGWYPYAVRIGRKFIEREKIRVIVSSSPPNTCHLIASSLKKKTGVLWIADFRDTWDVWCSSWYNPKSFSFRNKIEEKMEINVLKKADGIIGVSPEMTEDFRNRFSELPKEKFSEIFNGFDSEDFQNVVPHNFGSGTHLLHSGSLYKWRRPDKFLTVLSSFIQQHPEYTGQLHVHFLGQAEHSTRQLISKLDLHSVVQIQNNLPYKENISWIKGADILLLFPGTFSKTKVMVTTKVFDYLAVKKPIVVIGKECAALSLLRELSAPHLFLDEDDNNSIVEALVKICKGNNMFKNFKIDSVKLNQFERRNLTKELADLLNQLTG